MPGPFGMPQGFGRQQPQVGSAAFLQRSSGPGTIFTGYGARQQAGAGLIPQLGPFAPFAAKGITNMMTSAGMMPGQFSGTQNLYDQHRMLQRMQMEQAAVQEGSRRDIPTYINMLRNGAAVAGVAWGPQAQKDASMAAADMARIMPTLAQFAPGLVDQLHGTRGSAAVLAQGLFRGGRSRTDPTTGMPGLTDKTVGAYTEEISKIYDTDAGTRSMRGMGQGSAGMLFEQMQQRGYMPSTAGGPKLDAKRVSQRLKDMAGSVSAMREIFGDMGQPDAPMNQIINGLNMLTQGGMAHMDPKHMEKVVRRTKAVAETGGVGVDTVMALTQAAAQVGGPLGLHPSVAIQAGQYGALAAGASRQAGFAAAGVFGAASPEEVAAQSAKLAAQAGASEVTMSKAALLRLEAEAGGPDKSGVSPLKGNAGKLAEAIRTGADKVEINGKMQDVTKFLSRGAMNRAVSSGTDPLTDIQQNTLRTSQIDQAGAQEYIEKFGLAEQTATQQGRLDIVPRFYRPAAIQALSGTLGAAGVGDDTQRRAITRGVSGVMAEALIDSTAADLADPEAFKTYIDAKVRPALIDQMVASGAFADNDVGRAAAAKKVDDMMPGLASTFFSQANRIARRQKYNNLANMQQLFGTEQVRRTRRDRLISDTDVEVRTALDPFKSVGPLRSLMDQLIEPGLEKKNVSEVIGKALGGLSISPEAQAEVKQAMTAVHAQQAEIQRINKELGVANLSPSRRRELIGERAAAVTEIKRQAAAASKTLKSAGVGVGGAVDTERAKRAEERSATLSKRLDELDKPGVSDEDRAQASREITSRAQNVLGEAGDLSQRYLGSADDLAQLGKGGLEMVKKLDDRQLELRGISAKYNNDIGGLLSGKYGDPLKNRTRGLVKEIHTAQSDINAARGKGEELKDGKRKQMNDQLKRYNEERTQSEDKHRARALGDLGALAGGLAEDDKEKIGKAIGTDDARREFQARLSAVSKFREGLKDAEIADKDAADMDDTELRTSLKAAGKTKDEIDKIMRHRQRAGALTGLGREGTTVEGLMKKSGFSEEAHAATDQRSRKAAITIEIAEANFTKKGVDIKGRGDIWT